jgi:hypothetical protein
LSNEKRASKTQGSALGFSHFLYETVFQLGFHIP